MALNFRERAANHPFLNKMPMSREEFEKSRYLYMAGPEIFKFALTKVPKSILEVLEKTGYEADDIDYYVLHQANFRILASVAKRLGVSEDKASRKLRQVWKYFGGKHSDGFGGDE